MSSKAAQSMTEKARMRRIGELLARAIARQCQREELERARANKPDLPEDADPILIFVAQVGGASPKEIQTRFDLSRATAFRRLDRLVKGGMLKKEGSTTSRRYMLN